MERSTRDLITSTRDVILVNISSFDLSNPPPDTTTITMAVTIAAASITQQPYTLLFSRIRVAQSFLKNKIIIIK